jgi:hypothetical protein
VELLKLDAHTAQHVWFRRDMQFYFRQSSKQQIELHCLKTDIARFVVDLVNPGAGARAQYHHVKNRESCSNACNREPKSHLNSGYMRGTLAY